MTREKRFLCASMIGTFCSLWLIVLINYMVNPYLLFDSPRNFYNRYVNVEGHERLYKIQALANRDYEILLLGSSTVKKALYPDKVKELTGKTAYNGGVNGARLEEIQLELERAIRVNHNLRYVVIGLNYFMFMKEFQGVEPTFPIDFANGDYLSVYGHALLSADALKKSFNTVRNNFCETIHYNCILENGSLAPQEFRKEFNLAKNKLDFAHDAIAFRKLKGDRSIDERAFLTLKKIIDDCEEHNIELKLYINPVHAIYLLMLEQIVGVKEIFEWKKRIAQLHTVYDFSLYNFYTTEEFSIDRNYFRHSQHPTPILGDLILENILNNKIPPNDICLIMDRDNVEEAVLIQNARRKMWLRENYELAVWTKENVVNDSF